MMDAYEGLYGPVDTGEEVQADAAAGGGADEEE
jgi:hypothetical protein